MANQDIFIKGLSFITELIATEVEVIVRVLGLRDLKIRSGQCVPCTLIVIARGRVVVIKLTNALSSANIVIESICTIISTSDSVGDIRLVLVRVSIGFEIV